MHKIKIGLVGFGKHSIKVWLPILALNKHFILTAISSEKVDHASIDAEVKKLLPETHPPVSLFSEHDSLLKDSSIECVLIATSNIKHGPQVILALNNGKHVLCEKPLCFTEKHTNSIKKILESKKLTLETGFMYRYHPQWIFIKNYFSKIKNENWKILGQFQYNISSKSNYRNKFDLGGGALLDAGCYFLDICDFLNINQPQNHRLSNKNSNDGVDINTSIDLIFSEGQQASFYSSINQVRFQSFSIFGENSYIQVESPFIVPKNKKALIAERNETGKIKQHFFDFTDCYQSELDNFYSLICSDGQIGTKNNGLNNANWLSDLRRTN